LARRRVQWVNEPTSTATCEQKQGEWELEMSTVWGECIGHERPRAAGLLRRAEEVKEWIYHVIKGCNCLLECDE
jgi:hypothetical protein